MRVSLDDSVAKLRPHAGDIIPTHIIRLTPRLLD